MVNICCFKDLIGNLVNLLRCGKYVYVLNGFIFLYSHMPFSAKF